MIGQAKVTSVIITGTMFTGLARAMGGGLPILQQQKIRVQ